MCTYIVHVHVHVHCTHTMSCTCARTLYTYMYMCTYIVHIHVHVHVHCTHTCTCRWPILIGSQKGVVVLYCVRINEPKNSSGTVLSLPSPAASLRVHGRVCSHSTDTKSDAGSHAPRLPGPALQAALLRPRSQPHRASLTRSPCREETEWDHWVCEGTDLEDLVSVCVYVQPAIGLVFFSLGSFICIISYGHMIFLCRLYYTPVRIM